MLKNTKQLKNFSTLKNSWELPNRKQIHRLAREVRYFSDYFCITKDGFFHIFVHHGKKKRRYFWI
jgi:hypothetical protein